MAELVAMLKDRRVVVLAGLLLAVKLVVISTKAKQVLRVILNFGGSITVEL